MTHYDKDEQYPEGACNRDEKHLEGALEALLFVSTEPLKPKDVAEVLAVGETVVCEAFCALQAGYEERAAGIRLREIAGGWRLFSAPDYHEEVEALVLSWDKSKLSQAALETLAVVAYHQPVTREGIRAIRGVNSDGVLSSLIEKGYVREAGRSREKDAGLGAKTYRTTQQFLEHFGLASTKDLPNLEDFAPSEEAKAFIRERLSGPQTSFVLTGDAAEDGIRERGTGVEEFHSRGVEKTGAGSARVPDEVDAELRDVTEKEIDILEETFNE